LDDLELRFHPAAAAEADRARHWYAARNPHAAAAFVAELEHAAARVREAPNRWPRLTARARRYIFPNFPFSLVYRVKPPVIEVIAVAHHRRKPGYWSAR
jgi:plasmid stabilization system protein ParE